MKWSTIRLLLIIIGIILFSLVLMLEIDGTLGFIMASLGVGIIIIGLTIRVFVKLIMNIVG